MHHFNYQSGELYCENVPVRRIAAQVGTPFYLYSTATLEHHFRVFEASFQGFPHIVCFALKANANLAVLKLFAAWAAGRTWSRAGSCSGPCGPGWTRAGSSTPAWASGATRSLP